MARIVIEWASRWELACAAKLAEGLKAARPDDLGHVEITPSGLGIHFAKLDADLDLPALLEGFLGSKRWMAAEIGRLRGSTSGVAKIQAARKNGALGGRPKKAKSLAEA